MRRIILFGLRNQYIKPICSHLKEANIFIIELALSECTDVQYRPLISYGLNI